MTAPTGPTSDEIAAHKNGEGRVYARHRGEPPLSHRTGDDGWSMAQEVRKLIITGEL